MTIPHVSKNEMTSWFRKRTFWIALPSVFIFCMVSLGIVLTKGRRELAAYKASLTAQGEEINWKKLVKNHPPEEENPHSAGGERRFLIFQASYSMHVLVNFYPY